MPIRYEITNGALPVTVYLMQGLTVIDSNVHAIYEEGEFDVYADDYTLEFVDSMGCVEDEVVSPDTVLPCDVFLVTGDEGSGSYKIYSYNPEGKILTYRFEHAFYSRDIASTNTRLWILVSDGTDNDGAVIKEYIITLNPFTATFNRDLLVPDYGSYYTTGLGITYSNDILNKYILTVDQWGEYRLNNVTFDNSVNGIVEYEVVYMGKFESGDNIYNPTTGYYTVSTQDYYVPSLREIITYLPGDRNIVYNLNITGQADRVWGFFIYNNDLYAINSATPNSTVYKVNPDGLEYYDTMYGIQVQGASQSLNCGNYIPPSTTTTSTTLQPTTTTTTTSP